MILKPFQITGAQFLAERTRGLLADEPGVGKTAQIVTACDLVGARHVLVICPAVGIEHWRREFRRWRTPTVPGFSPGAMTITIISWDQARAFEPNGIYDVLVLDESHFAKNPSAQRTKAVFGKGGLAWYAKRIWCASGTPAPNHVGELYPMLKAFGAVKMNYPGFVAYFCRVDWMGKIRGTKPERRQEIRDILTSITLRRMKRDVLPELGEIDVQEWYVEPRSDFLNAYDYEPSGQNMKAVEANLRTALAGKSTADLLAFLAGSHEFATLRRYNAMLKAPAVFDQVTFEIENDLLDKVVIYGYHREPLQILKYKFDQAGIGAELIYGGTPAKDRDAAVQRWKKPGGPRVMLASIIAAGVVLDLTAAHQGIMLELGWVPGENSQSMQRMHRIGQDMPVTVRVAIGSEIDEIVSEVVLRKTRELTAIFDGAKV